MDIELYKMIPSKQTPVTVYTILEILIKHGTPREEVMYALSLVQTIHSVARDNVDSFLRRYKSETREENPPLLR